MIASGSQSIPPPCPNGASSQWSSSCSGVSCSGGGPSHVSSSGSALGRPIGAGARGFPLFPFLTLSLVRAVVESRSIPSSSIPWKSLRWLLLPAFASAVLCWRLWISRSLVMSSSLVLSHLICCPMMGMVSLPFAIVIASDSVNPMAFAAFSILATGPDLISGFSHLFCLILLIVSAIEGLFSAHLAMSVKQLTIDAQKGWVPVGVQMRLLTISGALIWKFLPHTALVRDRAISLEDVFGRISMADP